MWYVIGVLILLLICSLALHAIHIKVALDAYQEYKYLYERIVELSNRLYDKGPW